MKKLLLPLTICLLPLSARAIERDYENWNFKLSGYGVLGGAAALDYSDIAEDWHMRVQATRRLREEGWSIGLVYSLDDWSVRRSHPAKDAFAFLESPWGRAEFGFTDSVAAKLGLGLPDVGGMRVNQDPVIYDFADPYPMIARTTVSGAEFSARANFVSSPEGPVQMGFSFAPSQRHFNSASDFGLKYKRSGGKTKLAMSLGASFIDRPDDMVGDIYAPYANADWRAQLSAGLNLQYNSWVWGLAAKATYDRNPTGAFSDGLSLGTGLSYDLFSWSASASYMFSDIGVFHEGKNYLAHTGILSLRYKINSFANIWTSGGIVSSAETSPFISAGIMLKF